MLWISSAVGEEEEEEREVEEGEMDAPALGEGVGGVTRGGRSSEPLKETEDSEGSVSRRGPFFFFLVRASVRAESRENDCGVRDLDFAVGPRDLRLGKVAKFARESSESESESETKRPLRLLDKELETLLALFRETVDLPLDLL